MSLSFVVSRKFTRTDPGQDKVGKIAKDGNPMTILDIAKQGDSAFEGPVTYSFCANCEVRLSMIIQVALLHISAAVFTVFFSSMFEVALVKF